MKRPFKISSITTIGPHLKKLDTIKQATNKLAIITHNLEWAEFEIS